MKVIEQYFLQEAIKNRQKTQNKNPHCPLRKRKEEEPLPKKSPNRVKREYMRPSAKPTNPLTTRKFPNNTEFNLIYTVCKLLSSSSFCICRL